jgi:5-methylcytosine-specific restriction endonuclease McrA
METIEVERSLPSVGQSGIAALPSSPTIGHNSGAIARVVKPHNLMTLVLNSSYEPLSTWPLSLIPATEAITKLWKDRVQVVETWKDAFGEEVLFRSPSTTIPAPKVVVLNEYVCIHNEPKFSRRSILLRDRYCCQYCGKRFQASELTFDHLIPKSRGGKTEWTNIVMACGDCNAKKADQMPDFSGRKGTRKGNGLRPLKMPHRPTNAELLKAGLDFLSDQIREDFGSWLYWSVELDQD